MRTYMYACAYAPTYTYSFSSVCSYVSIVMSVYTYSYRWCARTGITLDEGMEQDTIEKTATVQCDNDFYTYDAQGDHGLCEDLNQDSSIEVEVPSETDSNEETEYTSSQNGT